MQIKNCIYRLIYEIVSNLEVDHVLAVLVYASLKVHHGNSALRLADFHCVTELDASTLICTTK